MIKNSTLNDLILYLYNELEEQKIQGLLCELNQNSELFDIFVEWINLMIELDSLEKPKLSALEKKLQEYSIASKATFKT
jgi:hypothetical protein